VFTINLNKSTDELLHKISEDLARKNVLVVNQHASERTAMRSMLATLNLSSIDTATRSAEVLRKVQKKTYDIIIADYYIDDKRNGQQLLEELRKKRLILLSTVYMIVASERHYHQIASVAELGPDSYIVRPFTVAQLQWRLVRAIYKKLCLGTILEYIDSGFYSEALRACDSLQEKDPLFHFDVLRFKGEILNTLGRYQEAAQVFSQAIGIVSSAPWAHKGLAMAYRGLGKSKEAEVIAMKLIEDFPEYLAVYDFIASLMEETGQLSDAQEILQRASVISPKNSERLQAIGNIAVRNDDLDTAESAYERVLKYRRGSSICSVEDYANLSRVFLSKGQVDSARKIAKDVLRDKQGEPHGELTAHVIESLCCSQEGLASEAKEALTKALALRDALRDDTDKTSQGLTIDLAHACFSAGEEKIAEDLLSKIMAENHEDRTVLSQVQKVFTQIGKERIGQTLLARVESEIVSLNNRGVKAAQKGDLKSSAQMLIDAAEQVPNLQFLVNAAKAIFSLLDESGWDGEMAEQGLRYLKMAKEKDPLDLKVISAGELYHQVARKYGVNVWMGERDPGAGENYAK